MPSGLVVTKGWNSCVGDLLGDPGPVSATLDLDHVVVGAAVVTDAAPVASLSAHRLDGVAHQVEQHLLDLHLVDQDHVGRGWRSRNTTCTPSSLAPTRASALASSTSLLHILGPLLGFAARRRIRAAGG